MCIQGFCRRPEEKSLGVGGRIIFKRCSRSGMEACIGLNGLMIGTGGEHL